MAKRETINLIIRTFKELGGNLSDVLGTRTNISFLGKGDNIEPFLDKNLNTQALGVLSQSKAVDEAKNAVGFAVGEKLNDIQANTLLMNLNKMKEFYMPPANITDLGTGTRNLDQEGLMSLRTTQALEENKPIFDKAMQGAAKESEAMRKAGLDPSNLNDFNKAEEMGIIRSSGKIEEDLKAMAERLGLNDPNKNKFLQTTDETIVNLSNTAGVPAKRANAREFLVEALKKDTLDPATSGFGKTNLSDVISAEDVKFITEGGGGIGGDPLVLVEKYFGPRIVELIPDEKITPRFINRLLTNVRDAAGRAPDDPRFDRFTATLIQEDIPFAKGGLAKILEV